MGTVEEVNLRVTRVRGMDGTVWYVPKGEIRKVGNSAKDWSRAILDVLVPPEADGGLSEDLLVQLDVLAHHAVDGEVALHDGPALATVDGVDALDGLGHLGLAAA
jgi:small-conductance mechanosensitive channel